MSLSKSGPLARRQETELDQRRLAVFRAVESLVDAEARPFAIPPYQWMDHYFNTTSIRTSPTTEDIVECISALIFYIGNILNDPTETKYHKIGLNNEVYRWRVKCIHGGEGVLLAVGFVPHDGRTLLYQRVGDKGNLQVLRATIDLLKAKKGRLCLKLDGLPYKSISGSKKRASTPVVPHKKSVRFNIGYADTIGRRYSMEDQMCVIGCFRGCLEEDFFAIFDGHGGKDAAVYAAKMLPHEVWKRTKLSLKAPLVRSPRTTKLPKGTGDVSRSGGGGGVGEGHAPCTSPPASAVPVAARAEMRALFHAQTGPMNAVRRSTIPSQLTAEQLVSFHGSKSPPCGAVPISSRQLAARETIHGLKETSQRFDLHTELRVKVTNKTPLSLNATETTPSKLPFAKDVIGGLTDDTADGVEIETDPSSPDETEEMHQEETLHHNNGDDDRPKPIQRAVGDCSSPPPTIGIPSRRSMPISRDRKEQHELSFVKENVFRKRRVATIPQVTDGEKKSLVGGGGGGGDGNDDDDAPHGSSEHTLVGMVRPMDGASATYPRAKSGLSVQIAQSNKNEKRSSISGGGGDWRLKSSASVAHGRGLCGEEGTTHRDDGDDDGDHSGEENHPRKGPVVEEGGVRGDPKHAQQCSSADVDSPVGPPEMGVVLRDAVVSVHNKMMDATDIASGTTVVAAWICGRKLVVANAGDSRAILVGAKGSVKRLSKDHKPALEEERARIAALGGFVTPGPVPRVNGKVAVSRAMGDRAYAPYITPEPHVHTHTLTRQDGYLVLACDGVWDELSDEQVGQLLLECRSAHAPLSRAAERIVMEALREGSMDNISVVVVDLNFAW